MAFIDLVELDHIKKFIGISDEVTKFDEEIAISIPFYVSRLQKLLGIDLDVQTQEDQEFLSDVISVMIACHLIKSDPSFGARYSNWKVGDSSKSYDKRTQRPNDTWCDLLSDLMSELDEFFKETEDIASATRVSITDTFTNFY